jgi:NinB protein
VKYDLDNPEQATTLMQTLWPKVKAALAAGKKLTLEVKDASKSRDTEKLYHELIGQIAKQAQHLGAKWSAEDFKRLLVDQFAREIGLTGGKIIPNLDGTGILQLGIQTRNFTQEQGSQFIEWLYAWGATNGITFE